MTNRDFYTNIITAGINDEITEFAQAALAKLDATNAKRRAASSKKAAENQPLIDTIVNEHLGDEPRTATDIGELMGVSTQKASALLRAAVAQGLATSQDVKIPKKGKQKGYTLGVDSVAVEEEVADVE